MPILDLNTQQYTEVMRSLMMAMTVDEHLASARGEKPDSAILNVWEKLLDRAEDFGMSFPPEEDSGEHWTDDLAYEADDTLHALFDVEFWDDLALRLAEVEHARSCDERQHGESCTGDIDSRVNGWLRRLLKEDGLEFLLPD